MSEGNIGTARFGFALAEDDAADFAQGPTSWVWVGGTGDVVVDLYGDGTLGTRTTVTLSAVPAGARLDIAAIRLRTASTATLLVGFKE